MTETTRLDFALFYDQHVERIYRYLLVRLGAPADAEDLTAETFRAALEGYSRLRADDSAAAWLVGIARHKLVDHFRRRKPVFPLEEATERPHPGPTVEEMAGQRLEMTRVARALACLNRERAEALALHYFAGLNLAEVGQSLGKSEEAAKKLVQRGLEELRQRLVTE
jgi:RNA polymerase sigma-70 factor, ECF subfamily